MVNHDQYFKREGIQARLPNCKIKNNICMAMDQIHNTFPALNLSEHISIIKEGDIKALAQVEGRGLIIRDGLSLQQIAKERNSKDGIDIFLVNEDLPRDLVSNPNYHTSPLNSNHATGLILHELGHCLSNNKKDFYNDFMMFIEKETGNSDYINTIAYRDLSLNSLFGPPEFFADAFTDCIINKSNASEAGKLIPKFLKEQGVI